MVETTPLHQPRHLMYHKPFELSLYEIDNHGKETKRESITTNTPTDESTMARLLEFYKEVYTKDIGYMFRIVIRRIEDGMKFEWCFDRYDRDVTEAVVISRYSDIVIAMMNTK